MVPVQLVPVKDELFSRFGGLLETDVLSEKQVAIFGLGSGGSQVAVELPKSGITKFDLIDHDRLEVGNVARHHCGLSDVGRLKVNAMADAIREKNPYAMIRTWPIKAEMKNLNILLDIIKDADLVIVATDNQESKLLLNKLSVKTDTPCIFGGANRRAYGGQVLRVKPHDSCCYQCFVMLLPDQAQDQEISSEKQAEGLAYTDRPVPIEPGLSTDIAPIALFVVKLAIQELLKGVSTTLSSLDEDLKAPWYLWLNRREAGTQFETLEPLEYNVDGMHVLRWYGIDINRHPNCPICGEFTGQLDISDISKTLDIVKNIGKQAMNVE